MLVKDIMERSFQLCTVNTPLRDAFDIFSKNNTGIIPIVDEKNRLIGILTKNRIIKAISKGYSLATPIKSLINYNPICVRPNDGVLDTREKLLQYMLGHAPVVNSNNEVTGIISTTQILFGYTKTLNIFQSQIHLLFNNLQLGLLSVDPNMNLTAINSLARKILQFNDREIPKKLLNYNKEIEEMIQYILINKEKPSKKKLNLNGYSFVVNCLPLFDQKKLLGVMVIIDDLTNLEELIKELQITKQWEEKLRALLELAYDAIVLVNGKGYITMANKGFCELFSTSEKKMLGTSILNNFPDLGIKEVIEMKIPLIGTTRLINSKQCLISNLPIINNGELVGVVSKITFRGLRQLHDALGKVNKLERNPDLLQKDQNIGTRYSISDIIGTSKKLTKVKKEAYAASQSRSTVLLIGESGTGKELFAHGIHTASSLPGHFIKVNCAAIPGELLESEFFGYAEGAFSGAKKGGKKGKFELAQHGTLFLDEIGDMPLNLQSKLLRVLQEKELEPIGSNKTIKLEIRIIAATNKNLEKMVKNGEFREDLYYRLNILRLNIPPLRDRKDDIPDIVDFIIDRLNFSGFDIKGITSQTLSKFLNYNWPGNIREMQNVIERAANLNENGYIDVSELPDYILEHQNNDVDYILKEDVYQENKYLNQIGYKESVIEKERELIIDALKKAKGNKTKASKILGISRTWLYKKIKKYNIVE